jgi:hypothetical protein
MAAHTRWLVAAVCPGRRRVVLRRRLRVDSSPLAVTREPSPLSRLQNEPAEWTSFAVFRVFSCLVR